MDPKRYQLIQEFFEQAVELSPPDRLRFLEDLKQKDQELYREVDSLLAADEAPDSLLDRPVAESLDISKALTEEGKRIGPYRLVKLLGTGGMGTVYVAERIDGQYRREVALKLIRPGMDSEHILQRFQAERQILAQLDHPNIARMLDGGLTDDGRPYFTMEYVQGRPIDVYCRQKELSVEDRLRLFEQVCATVQYAQENLIVHRDLKPSNIMVTDEGEVKLLDFGVAKVLDVSAPFDMPKDITRTGFRVMTPAYASPEQIRGEPVTTASDVYSLGVVLYELLTGRSPLLLIDKTPSEIERLVSSEEPPRPSLVAGVTPSGKTDPQSQRILKRRLRGDLDNICLMALRKEPSRRYRSAEQLRADIRRHLEDRPVHARPSSLGYQARKFVGRNRAVLAASAAILIVAAMLVTYYTVQLAEERDVAQLEAEKSLQVTEFLVGLFEISDPNEAKGRDITARELLDEGAERIRTELADQPEVQTRLTEVIGGVYYQMGVYERADSLLSAAAEMSREVHGSGTAEYASIIAELAGVKEDLGDYEEAGRLYLEALRIDELIHGEWSEEVASDLTNLGAHLKEVEGMEAAEPLFRKALEIRRDLLGDDHVDVAHSLNHLGRLLQQRGDIEEARPLLMEALSIRERHLGDLSFETIASLGAVAGLYRSLHMYDSSEIFYRRALNAATLMMEDDHQFVGGLSNSLGHVLREQGKYVEAEELFRKSLEILTRTLPEGHANQAYALTGLGLVLAESERPSEGEAYLRKAVAIRQATLGEAHWMTAISTNCLGFCLYKLGKFQEARRLLQESQDVFMETFGPDHGVTRQALERMQLLEEAIKAAGRPDQGG